MTYPKIKPCPKCGNDDMGLYTYDHGWKHVECDDCYYMGPGQGSKLQAIRAHNEQATANRFGVVLTGEQVARDMCRKGR